MSEKRILRVGLIQQANTADHSATKCNDAITTSHILFD